MREVSSQVCWESRVGKSLSSDCEVNWSQSERGGLQRMCLRLLSWEGERFLWYVRLTRECTKQATSNLQCTSEWPCAYVPSKRSRLEKVWSGRRQSSAVDRDEQEAGVNQTAPAFRPAAMRQGRPGESQEEQLTYRGVRFFGSLKYPEVIISLG